jgi:hypothetical protein
MVRSFIAFATLIGVIISSRGEQIQDSNESTSEFIKLQVLAAEDSYVLAEIKRDSAELHRLVDDKFILNSGDGTTLGKKEFIKAVLRMNMTDQTLSERSIIIEGNIGIVLGTTEIEFHNPGEDPRISKLRYTSIYVKRKDEWRMLALQMQSHSTK